MSKTWVSEAEIWTLVVVVIALGAATGSAVAYGVTVSYYEYEPILRHIVEAVMR